MKAYYNDTVIAESDATVVVEGNHYFPPEAINEDYFMPTDHRTRCPWKGEAQYYTITVDGKTNENAAWTYLEPKDAAAEIRKHVAFWKGITVKEE